MQHKILVPFISLQTKRIILSRTRKLISIKREYLLEDRAGVKIEGQTAGAGSGGEVTCRGERVNTRVGVCKLNQYKATKVLMSQTASGYSELSSCSCTVNNKKIQNGSSCKIYKRSTVVSGEVVISEEKRDK